MSELIGKTIGQYQIVEQIGLGGMATIFKAYQPSIDRYVALKILPRSLAAQDPNFVKRFQHEAKAIAALEHPHILPVHDFGSDQGYNFMVMRYVEGGTLTDLMGRNLSWERIIQIVGNIARALDYAHSRGVVHRDIKPSNILIDKHGEELLTDFGIAKIIEGEEATQLTSAGSILGTPAYMAPEQAEGKAVDGRTDIYSLGVVLYELLTGQPPYQAETPLAVVLKHLHAPLPPPRTIRPDIPETLERAVLKAMAKKPADRFETAGEMERVLKLALKEVEAVAPTQEVPVRSVKTGPKPVSPAKSGPGLLTPLLIGGGVLALFLCLVGGGITLWAIGAEPSQPTATPESGAIAAALPTPTRPSLPTFTPVPTLPTDTPAPDLPTQTPALPDSDTIISGFPNLDTEVLMEDDFSSNAYDWFEGDNNDDYGDYNAQIVDGRYRLRQKAAKGVFSWETAPDTDFDNFVMSVEATPVESSAAFAFGVVFRNSDNEKFYAFEVDTDGYFFVNRFENGQWQKLVDFTQMAAIDGEGTNQIVVEAIDSSLRFFINGEEAIAIEDDVLDTGTIGVALEVYEADDSAVVDFDNLTIYAVDGGSTQTEDNENGIFSAVDAGEIIFEETFDSNRNGWATGQFEDDLTQNAITIADGLYQMDLTAKQKAYVEKVLPNQDFADFVLTLEATPLDTEEHYSYGVAFRENESSLHTYAFEIGNDGFYSVQVYDGEWQSVVEWDQTDAIIPGETNELGVVADGSSLSFWINGEELASVEDDTLTAGTLGLIVEFFEEGKSARVNFDNLVVREINGE